MSWTGKEKILTENQVTFTSATYINLILNVGLQKDTWKVTVIDPELKVESNTISFNVVSAEKEIVPTTEKKSKIVKKAEPIKSKITSQATKTVVTKNIPVQKQKSGLYEQNWIRQQNKNYFTIQLLGTHQENSLPAYLKKFALKNDAAYFKTKRNDKDWFTLVYGSYPTKSAAQTAAKKLPKGTAKPWIRSFASILPSLTKEVTVKISPVATPTQIKTNNQEGWLWSQDPRHYTLQLAAGTDKKAIQVFIKRYKLQGKAVFFHRLRDGKDWYILVHGSYTGYSKAKQAISQLPQAVQKAKPWARSFGAIHSELN